ncbi:hypothetical protein BVG19_g1119 [[Candida] boidinii]|nr:hypothetical protein BVG19_g1119 [[Candida] boidinii]OWB50137.1 hypothetical protein B5S27_g1684 [[Candida] boidinii]
MFSIFDLGLVKENNKINKSNGFNPFSFLYNRKNSLVSTFNSILSTFNFNWILNELNFFKQTSPNSKLITNDRNAEKVHSDELEGDLFTSSIEIDIRLTNNSVKPCAVTDLDFQGINYEYFDYEDSNHLTDLNTNNNISNNTNGINNNSNNYKNPFEEFNNPYNTINNHGLYNNNSNFKIPFNDISGNADFNVGSSSSNHEYDDSIDNGTDYNHNFVKFNQNSMRENEFDLDLLPDVQSFPGHSFEYEKERLHDKKGNAYKDVEANSNNNPVSITSNNNSSEVNANPFNWNLRELVLEDDSKFNNSKNSTEEEEEVSDYYEEIDHSRSFKETINDDFYGNEFALDDEYCLEKCFSRTETTKVNEIFISNNEPPQLLFPSRASNSDTSLSPLSSEYSSKKFSTSSVSSSIVSPDTTEAPKSNIKLENSLIPETTNSNSISSKKRKNTSITKVSDEKAESEDPQSKKLKNASQLVPKIEENQQMETIHRIYQMDSSSQQQQQQQQQHLQQRESLIFNNMEMGIPIPTQLPVQLQVHVPQQGMPQVMPQVIPLQQSQVAVETNHYQVMGAFVCSICSTHFRVKSYLTRHMKKHETLKPFICPFFDTRDCDSEETEENEKEETHPHDCSKSTSSLQKEDTNEKDEESETDKELPKGTKCHPTGGFSRRDTFKTHLKALHFVYPIGTKSNNRNMTPGRCAGCFEGFENNALWLENHIATGECPAIINEYK